MHRILGALSVALAAAVTVGSLAGCSADEPVIMPDVVGMKLDDAKKDVGSAGFTDDVDVEGGGLLGVVIESNWTVCGQKPKPGRPLTGTPQLTVARDCGGDEPEESEAPSPSASATPEEPQVLTVENDPALKALLTGTDECGDAVADFATKNEGKTIAFDASIGAIAPHGDYTTRFDILLGAGDDGLWTRGPSFQFRDVNLVSDLHWKGENVPGGLGVGQNLRVTAEVGEFNPENCLFQLDPVSTKAR